MQRRVAITTSKAPSREQLQQVEMLRQRFDLPFFAREKFSIVDMIDRHHVDWLFIVEAQRLVISDGKSSFFWHPNTATLKLKQIDEPINGSLVKALAITAGHHVLDCTMGLASDSLVIAAAVGAGGRVTALESSPYICYMTAQGLKMSVDTVIRHIAKRIVIDNANYRDYLKQSSGMRFDAIYFDPMFRQAKMTASGLSQLRSFADYSPIRRQDIDLARTHTNGHIVVKERWGSGILEALNPHAVIGRRRKGKVVYGVFKR